jgi:hypothetical protein
LQPAHLASGGILKGWAFEDFTGTMRVAKMAKSRDSAKERYWRGVIQRFEASGLGVRRFCDREGLPEHRLYWWRRTLRRRGPCRTRHSRRTAGRGPVRDRGDQQGETSFLPVGLPFSVGGPIEVVHPRGHVIRVPAIFDPTALGRILAAIDATASGSGEP